MWSLSSLKGWSLAFAYKTSASGLSAEPPDLSWISLMTRTVYRRGWSGKSGAREKVELSMSSRARKGMMLSSLQPSHLHYSDTSGIFVIHKHCDCQTIVWSCWIHWKILGHFIHLIIRMQEWLDIFLKIDESVFYNAVVDTGERRKCPVCRILLEEMSKKQSQDDRAAFIRDPSCQCDDLLFYRVRIG